jgi:hypothetical protein
MALILRPVVSCGSGFTREEASNANPALTARQPASRSKGLQLWIKRPEVRQ